MCLAIPGRIIEIKGDDAVVDYGGVTKKASLRLCPEAAVGECALYDVNGAIGRSTVCALAQKRRS